MCDIRKSTLTLCLVTPANWRTIASHASTSQRLPTLRIRSSRFVSIGGSKIRPTQNFNPPYKFTGVETRTSSPGRPGRGEEDGQSLTRATCSRPAKAPFTPGGILSGGMEGIRAAEWTATAMAASGSAPEN